MEMGILVDDRKLKNGDFALQLTPDGKALSRLFETLLNSIDISFKIKGGELPSWEMSQSPQYFNLKIKEYIMQNEEAKNLYQTLCMNMPAVELMLNYFLKIFAKKDCC